MRCSQSALFIMIIAVSVQRCDIKKTDPKANEEATTEFKRRKSLVEGLPTIGVLLFDGFLSSEVVAPLDVFTKRSEEDHQLFNVVLIAKTMQPLTSEEGLTVLPNFTMDNLPELSVLIVPSSYHPEIQQKDKDLLAFISKQNETTDFMASHCAGAFLLAAAGVADDKKLVTYISGGELLQSQFPNVLVQDDAVNMVVEDGKLMSSNGNLVSYIASLELLEKMTSKQHRIYVEKALYLDRLMNFK